MFMSKSFYIIKSKGRFGNQLFQILHVISDWSKNSTIIALNFTETQRILSSNTTNIYFIHCNKFIDRFCDFLFKIIIRYKIFSTIEQNSIETCAGLIDSSSEKFIPGLFRNFIVITGFFQSAKFLSNINRYSYRISSINQIKSSEFIFVHFRKSDYKDIYFLNKTIILDSCYYKKAIEYFSSKNSNVKFLLFSDENISICDLNLFNGYDFKISSLNNPVDIYEEMLSCSGGVISNSSLSWLAGFHLKKINDSAIVVAPLNHIGHNVNIEIPDGINHNEFIYF
jgi:hypothetical protein